MRILVTCSWRIEHDIKKKMKLESLGRSEKVLSMKLRAFIFVGKVDKSDDMNFPIANSSTSAKLQL